MVSFNFKLLFLPLSKGKLHRKFLNRKFWNHASIFFCKTKKRHTIPRYFNYIFLLNGLVKPIQIHITCQRCPLILLLFFARMCFAVFWLLTFACSDWQLNPSAFWVTGLVILGAVQSQLQGGRCSVFLFYNWKTGQRCNTHSAFEDWQMSSICNFDLVQAFFIQELSLLPIEIGQMVELSAEGCKTRWVLAWKLLVVYSCLICGN